MDRGWPRDDVRQRSLVRHLKLLRSRERQRKSDQLFGMGNTGAGPRWLAESRYGSAFRHWHTAATAAPVRHQGQPEEKQRFLAKRAQETEQRRASLHEQFALNEESDCDSKDKKYRGSDVVAKGMMKVHASHCASTDHASREDKLCVTEPPNEIIKRLEEHSRL